MVWKYFYKSILYIILTVIIQFIGLQCYALPNSSDTIVFKIVAYVLAVTLLALACWQRSTTSIYLKRALMVQNPASFRTDKIDCYVSFTGRLSTEKSSFLPLSGKECAFYQASIIAEWQTKKKKPAKGLETQRKPLFRKESSPEFKLVKNEQRVYIKTEDFGKKWLRLHKNIKSRKQCPPKIKHQADKKYVTYQLSECFAHEGETLTAQGRLTRAKDGRLFIKPTGRKGFPSFVAIRQKRNGAAALIQTIAEEAVSKMQNGQVRIVVLIANALFLLYIWW
ncbi:MAG: hypothetical protein D3924_19295 [Candidatus Electrothrix sp. AR4]|nr:hypothetical protein [Candidatus Electrothrix sp. AR4]